MWRPVSVQSASYTIARRRLPLLQVWQTWTRTGIGLCRADPWSATVDHSAVQTPSFGQPVHFWPECHIGLMNCERTVHMACPAQHGGGWQLAGHGGRVRTISELPTAEQVAGGRVIAFGKWRMLVQSRSSIPSVGVGGVQAV